MSKTIDEKVVEMKFDNKNFEANVQTSLSTLDKLKQKLNLNGATKGLENVKESAKNLSFNNIESSLASLEKRFSTTGIVGMTVIQNLTTAGMNLVKKLSGGAIDSILGGGKRRATNLENARFQLEGLLKDAGKVEGVMKNVSDAVDGTAYSLDAAANVASQLAASGMEAGDKMFKSLRGVAGVAAMTNSSYEDIGRIYTQVAGQGRLMGDQLLQLSGRGMNAAATLAKYLNKTEAEVRDMTSKGKIDFETFAAAMDDAFGEHAKAANNTVNGAMANIKSALARIGALFYEPLIKQKGPLVQFLNEVRVAINGVKKSMEPIAEEITTKINNALLKATEIFKRFVAVLNWSPLVKFKDTLKGMSDTLKGTLKPINSVKDSLDKVKHTVEDYNKLVDRIIRGDFKNAPVRYQLLAEAGYDWAYAQNLVNERLGSTVRHATNFNPAAEEMNQNTENVAESTEDLVENLVKLSKQELIAKGFTEEQAEAIKTLGDVSKKTGISVKELMKLIDKDQFDAKFLIFNSFKNIGMGIVTILKSIGSALMQVFSVKSEGLFDIVAAIHKFTMIFNEKIQRNAEGLTNTLKGLFSIIHLITSIIGGGFKIALKLLNAILGAFNLNILDVTGGVGELIFKFEQWLTKESGLVKMLQKLVTWVGWAAQGIRRYVTENEKLMTIINNVRNALHKFTGGIKDFIDGFKNVETLGDVPKYIFQGLVNGLKNAASGAFSVLANIATGLVELFKKILGIHSPSVVFFAIGGFIIAGLIGGLINSSGGLFEAFKSIGSKCIEIFNKIDWGKLLAAGMAVGLLFVSNKIVNVIKSFTHALGAPLEGLGNMLNKFGDAASMWAQGKKFEMMTQGVKNIAVSILILAGSLLLISRMSWSEIGKSLTALLGVMILFGALIFVLTKMDLESLGGSKVGFIKVSGMLAALSIGMFLMAHSIKTLGKMSWDEFKQSIIGMAGIMASLVILCKAISKLAGNEGLKDIDKVGKLVRKISTSLIIIVLAMKLASILKPTDFINGIACMTLFGLFAAAMIAASKFGGADADKAGKMIRKMATSLLIIIAVIKLSGTLKEQDIQKGIQVLKAVGILFGAIIAVSRLAGQNGAKAGLMLLQMSFAMIIMVGVIKLIGTLKPNEIKKGIVAIGFLSLFFTGLIAVSNLAGQNAIKAGAMLLMVSSSMLILVGVLFLLGKINPDELKRSLGVVSIISLLFAGLMAASYLVSGDAATTISKMCIAIGVLAASIAILSLIDQNKLLGAAKSLGIVLVAFGVMINSTKHLTGSVKFWKQLLPMTIIIGLLSLIVGQLAKIPNPDGAVKAAESLGLMLIAMSGALVILNKVGNINKDSVKAIGALALMAGPLALFMLILNNMGNTQNAIQNTIALAALAGAMTLLLIPINSLGQLMMSGGLQAIGGVALGVAALSAMAAPLALFMLILNGMRDTQNAIENVKALSLLCAAMTLLLIPLTILGAIMIGTGGIAIAATALGIVALCAMVAPMLVFIDALKKMNGIENAIERMNIMMEFMTRMTDILIKVSLVAPLALMADMAIGGFIGAMVAVGTLAVAVGALMEKFPNLQTFLDTGIPVLVQIADGIGQIIGAFIKGALVELSAALPEIGMNLSLFMLNLTPFIVGMKSIDGKVLAGVGILTGTIIALTAAELINGIMSLFGLDIANLGTRLSDFANNASGFFETVKGIDSGAMQGVKSLAEAIMIITAADLVQGIMSLFSDKSAVEKFGEQLPILGRGLNSFVEALGPLSEDQIKSANAAAEIIKTLAAAAKEIPNTGGLLAGLVGDNDMGPWATQLPIMAAGIASFVQIIQNGNIEQKAVETARTAAEVIKTLAAAAKEIPNAGGLLASLVGDNEMGKFAEQFPVVGDGVVKFVQKMVEGGITKDSVETAKVAAEIIGVLAKVSKEIPNTGGLLASLIGDNDLGKFAEKLPDVGRGLNNFAKELSNFTKDKVECIQTAVSAIYALAALSSLNLKDAGNSYGEFGKKLVEFGKKLREFMDEITKTSTEELESASDKISKVLEMVFDIEKVNIDGMKKFAENLKDIAKEGVNGFVNEFSGNDPKAKAKEAIQAMIDAAIEGAEAKKSNVTEKFREVAGAAIQGLEDATSKNKTYNLGRDFVQGFANGISGNERLANNAASNLGKHALEAAKRSIDSHSPSKETFKLGTFFDLGFVNGIKSLSNRVYSVSSNVGERAKDGLNNAIRKVSNILNSDMDMQPTIRPVLDLSDIKDGAGNISSMFTNPSLAVASNLGAISTGMARNRQNGNDDVVSAINKLGKSLSGRTGNTYNVNGITYDDGSEISNAVSELVRAARVERRV